MATFSITYDLRNPGRDYDKVISKIKLLGNGNWCRPTESAWFIKSNLSAGAIRDAIASVTDSNDKIMVHSVASKWASNNLDPAVNSWLKANWQSACVVG